MTLLGIGKIVTVSNRFTIKCHKVVVTISDTYCTYKEVDAKVAHDAEGLPTSAANCEDCCRNIDGIWLLYKSIGSHRRARVHVRSRVLTRGVSDSGLESAPEYEFGSFLLTIDGDSGSGSFQVWSRFQAGIGSTTGPIT